MRQDFENQRMMLSQEAAMDKEKEYKAKVREFLQEQQAFEQATQEEIMRVLSPVIEVLDQVIADYAKKNGYDMIMDTQLIAKLSSDMYRGVHYYGDSVDITNQIMVELNRAWKERQ